MDLFNQTPDTKELPFKLPQKDNYSYQWNDEMNGFVISIPNGQLFYSEHFFDKKVSDRSIEYFLENETNDWQTADWRSLDKESLSQIKFKNINWHHDQIKMFGKPVFLPRYSAWYGDSDKPYTYSGLTLQPNKWNKGLLHIKEQIEKVAGVHFNSVLMNWYRDGEDYISWHCDDEKELGKNPVIGSVNFGATRRFQLRRLDNNEEKIEVPLKHGTFLLMSGETQHYWQHAVPKEKKIKEARFNLTFRIINH
ncbi:alpha-ketoglutarate-dependent dioxygenase AlkB family protein [Parafilimonas sp.]|uniref:alpha-ketoglutarate-dependent dioxygenase AlkB family protein n=1 Tax=Parafilimonas sp. TaxID=1969739 RepID=UPI0039E52C2F